jgi:hypothetical protein
MNLVSLIIRELIGMFIDDEFLAVAILAVVALAAACGIMLAAPQAVVGGVLLSGCIVVLVLSAYRGSRKH